MAETRKMVQMATGGWVEKAKAPEPEEREVLAKGLELAATVELEGILAAPVAKEVPAAVMEGAETEETGEAAVEVAVEMVALAARVTGQA